MNRAFLPILLAALCGCSDDKPATGPALPEGCARPAEELPEPARHTPRWGFEPWISKDISDGPDTYAFVKGFHDRDIPVGAVVLDSPWETNYNTFVPNPTRYPDFAKMVSDMHASDVRVVLWITNFVNSVSYDLEKGGDAYTGPAPALEEGNRCGYFIEDGTTFAWWKGTGAAVDFFDSNATAWWHEQQNTVLDAGIDGWKIDFGDSYVRLDNVLTEKGSVPRQEYSEAYYRDFLAYGVARRGPEFVTMVRAYDESYDFAGRFFARKEHAPVAWMGDNRRDWVGLADALDHTFRSAAAGYVVLGSDIGGYLDRDDKNLVGPEIPLDPQVFARWTAVGALSPFMQLHGRANITPWTVPQTGTEIVDAYRYWSKLHHELVPFFYSLAEEAYAGGAGIVRPIGKEADWSGDYRYTLGDALLVAPLLDATGKRDVALPPEAPSYYDLWSPAAAPAAGGSMVPLDYAGDFLKLPVFFRAGAIVPMNVGDAVTGFGDESSKGKLTLVIYPDVKASSFTVHDEDGQTTLVGASSTTTGAEVSLSRAAIETLVRVRAEEKPASVAIDGAAQVEHAGRGTFDAAPSGWFYETTTRSAWIKVPAGAAETKIQINKP